MKGSLSSCSLNSENPYATISDAKPSESSYVEMTSPAHRDHMTRCCSAANGANAIGNATAATANPKNVYDMGTSGVPDSTVRLQLCGFI